MNVLRKHDRPGLGDSRAREILATARAHLVGHVDRDDRIAAELALARDNIIRLDPKRVASTKALTPREQQLEREAAAARQARVKRTLSAARATLRRVAHIKAPAHKSEIVHKTTENARVTPPEAASPASRKREAAVSADAMESLNDRIEILRQAVPEALGTMIADLRRECQREHDGLRRELDVTHRELDLLRRTLAAGKGKSWS